MRVKGPMLATLVTLGLAYAAYPYVTLYRISYAIRGGDAHTLEALVNWSSVREGIKEDICDLVVDDPAPQHAGGTLPPFGASFMRGIASNAIDRAVTPQALLAATGSVAATPAQTRDPAGELKGADVHVSWAFFDSPTSFLVSLSAAGQGEPIKLEMVLRHGAWQVDRVWLPTDVLSGHGDRT